ncbi:hypothetical protein Patl1_01353 [Pistacia atlantica]|uniref:Uncharacterized protein n=1 Tax=Pistacia atlantica TaxID=434234 RepID=A0ACC1CC00_9ROSI|nr:hypothetical protein Patl1_01353 [Pistacia atlantica]
MQRLVSFLDSTETFYDQLLKYCNVLAPLKQIHSSLTTSGFIFQNPHLGAQLIIKYAKYKQPDNARSLFNTIHNDKPNSFLWNTMIRAYAANGHCAETLELYSLMRRSGISANNFTFPFVLKVCASKSLILEGKVVHGDVIRAGFHSDLYVEAALVDMYAKCGQSDDGCKVFDKMLMRDLVSWNSIVAMYAKCGNVKKARMVFDRMEERDGISWNSMLSGYTQNGQASEALLLFDEMEDSGCKPNPVTALILVSACAYLGSRHLGRKLHEFIINSNTKIDVTLWSALMDMYAKCGDLDTAESIFNDIHPSERNVSSWNVLISGYGMHGRGEKALELFTQMQEEGVEPNHITFTSVLSACSHAGLIDEGRKCFADMTKLSVKTEVKHYACMVDMLGRAGLLYEAFDIIKHMPSSPNDSVWGALLLACRIHGDTKLGQIAANNLFQLEPEHAGYYVLMSNIYAASNKWQEVGKLRQDMKNKGLKKAAAFSVIEIAKEIHGFHTADQVNPYWEEVYKKVESLAVEMKMAGYVPDLSCVLHDVEEEDKEHTLNYHSEKLAVAFGIMKMEPEMAIRVTKNLRVCNDCHSAFKLISYIYGRKIIVRDANRFHHFKDGTCSCKDYW